MSEAQSQASEWHDQWSLFEDHEHFLFADWIQPATLDDFLGREVLEGGCGGGQHTAMVSRVASAVTAVDLNTIDIARKRNADRKNISYIAADLASMELGKQFDVVFSIGVLHHTDNPDRAFENLFRHCKPGGLMIVWVYSAEGNLLVRYGVEPVRRYVLRHLPRRALVHLSSAITALLYPIVYTIYRLESLRFLPYFDYFKNFRKLPFERNVLNVFDKLNAPQTAFISRDRCERWMNPQRFAEESVSIRPYLGVSYSLVGRRKDDHGR